MSYSQKKSSLAPMLIGAAILLAAIAVIAFFVMKRAAPALDTPAGIEQALLADPVNAPIYDVMKRAYPDEFEALTREGASAVKAGKARWQINMTILNAVFATEKRHRAALAQASPARLAAYRKAQTRAIEALRDAGPAYCATFLNTGQMRLPEGTNGPAPALADLHIAILEALADGRDHPVGRTLAPPSPADWALVDKTMVASGIDAATARAFFDPVANRGMTADNQCKAGLSFMRAIESLPPKKVDPFFIGLINALP
ncbi:MAG: hypothetical protein ACAH11_12420 [Sphingomonas sp.]